MELIFQMKHSEMLMMEMRMNLLTMMGFGEVCILNSKTMMEIHSLRKSLGAHT